MLAGIVGQALRMIGFWWVSGLRESSPPQRSVTLIVAGKPPACAASHRPRTHPLDRVHGLDQGGVVCEPVRGVVIGGQRGRSPSRLRRQANRQDTAPHRHRPLRRLSGIAFGVVHIGLRDWVNADRSPDRRCHRIAHTRSPGRAAKAVLSPPSPPPERPQPHSLRGAPGSREGCAPVV